MGFLHSQEDKRPETGGRGEREVRIRRVEDKEETFFKKEEKGRMPCLCGQEDKRPETGGGGEREVRSRRGEGIRRENEKNRGKGNLETRDRWRSGGRGWEGK